MNGHDVSIDVGEHVPTTARMLLPRGSHRSSGLSPVCFAMRASMRADLVTVVKCP